ncbi:MAG TPA: hypothetical protein VK915_10780 [Gaiellaceae bacterium]|nr:hypothetical protein [Gaiellaceae bacterium]
MLVRIVLFELEPVAAFALGGRSAFHLLSYSREPEPDRTAAHGELGLTS